MPIFRDHARAIWECGFSIIPVNGKRAFLSYDKYRERQCSESELSEWEERYGDYNIGIVTGPASKLIAIDIDTNEPELLNKVLSLLPNSPLQRFGSKGIALFVRWENQAGRAIHYKGRRIGELIVNTQIVIPPSIHPDTQKPYQWTGYMQLGSESVDDVFLALPSFNDHDLEVFERRLAEESLCVGRDFFSQRVNRNDKLKSICGALFNQGFLPEQIAPRLLAEDLALHGDNALFSDESEFKSLARQPLACAYRFASSIFATYIRAMSSRGEVIPQFHSGEERKDAKYSVFHDFFSRHLASCKRDVVSGELMEKRGPIWEPVINRIEVLQSLAISEGIPHTQLKAHFKRYCESLKPVLLCEIPEWDGHDWIHTAVSYVRLKGAEDPFLLEDYLKLWGANLFKRIDNAEHQNFCLILKGDQGIGKDEFIKSMLSGLAPYVSKFRNAKDERDIIIQATRNLVLRIEEFDQTNSHSVAFLKDLITSGVDEVRLPYDIAPKRLLNRCSYISTVNVDSMLRDTTGNRRFKIIDVERIDWGYPKDWSLKILAQMRHLARVGYEISGESEKKMAAVMDLYTPESDSDIIVEMWNMKLENVLCTTTAPAGTITASQAAELMHDIARTLGVRFKTVRSTIIRHGGQRRTAAERLYRPIQTSGVVVPITR